MNDDDHITYEDFVKALAKLEQHKVLSSSNFFWTTDPNTLRWWSRVTGRFGVFWVVIYRLFGRWL